MIERYIAIWKAATGREFAEYTLTHENNRFVFRSDSGVVDSIFTEEQFVAHAKRLKEMPDK